MRKKYKLKKELKKLLILFLGMALATQLVGNSVVFAMNDNNDVIATYEVGVEGNNVIATLTKDGTMTLSGAGDTKDYTSDTMPFQDNISNIKDIVIEDGVTSIGNAMFYNCKDVTGKLVIPSTVVEIGDYAFAGDSYESAPKITKIENSFTQSNIVVETPVEKKVEDSTTEKNTEEQETSTAEEPVADTTSQDDTTKQEEQIQETVKTVKSITEQQIGKNIFVQGQNGGYSCAETNKAFINAVEEAGYVRADRFVLVKMDDSITQEVPVIEGQLVLPSKPDTLGVPAEDDLTSYQFAGWMVEGADKVLNPKDNYSISDDVEELNLTSQWQQTWKINPKVKTEAKEEVSLYSVVDSNTGKLLEKVNGYTINVQWQINKKDMEDENSWENIENATSFMYKRKIELNDISSYFRANIIIQKNTMIRSITEVKEFITNPVNGQIKKVTNTSGSVKVIYHYNDSSSTSVNNSLAGQWDPVSKTYTTTATIQKDVGNSDFYGDLLNYTNMYEYKISLIQNPFTDHPIVANGVSDVNDVASWVYGNESNPYTNWNYPIGTSGKSDGYTNPDRELSNPNYYMQDGEYILSEKEKQDLENGKDIEINFYAYWGKVVYASQDGKGSNDGSSVENAVKIGGTSFDDACSKFSGGDMFSNVILLISDTRFQVAQDAGDAFLIGNNNSITISSIKNNDGSRNKIIIGNRGLKLTNDLRFVDITMKSDTHKWPLLDASKYYLFIDDGIESILEKNGIHNLKNFDTSSETANLGYDPADFWMGIFGSEKGLRIESGIFRRISGNLTDGNNSFVEIEGSSVTNPVVLTDEAIGGLYSTNETNITINGYVIGAGAYSGTAFKEQSIDNTSLTIKSNAKVVFAEYINGKQTVMKGVYGGGRLGKVTTSATINIESGAYILGNVYAGSRDNTAGNNGTTVMNIGKAVIIGSVYGGGNDANSDDITLNLDGTKIYKTSENSSIIGKGELFVGGFSKTINKSATVSIKNSEIGTVYAGNDNATMSIIPSITIANSNIQMFYGGGNKGEMSNTGKYIYNFDSGIYGNIYGSGNSAGNKGVIEINIKQGVSVNNIYGGSNSTGTSTESTVNINGEVNANVYGGGNGAGTTVTTSTVNIESAANITGNVFGGGELGDVGTSNVNLNGGTIAGKVFGGGNNVGVTTSNVKVDGTINLTQNDSAIFGGSNAKGTTDTSNVNINSGIDKNVYGGGLGSDTIVNNSNINTKAKTNEIYGGGKEGIVKRVVINLNSGATGANVFGGGHLVGIEDTVEINAKSGSNFTNIYGGSNENGTVKNPVINYEGKATSVYGAGKGANTITLNPSIIVGQCEMTQSVYGGGEKGVTKGIANVTINKQVSVMNLFGAGNEAGVDGDTNITITADGAAGYVFGGSYSSGEVTGTAKINISGNAFFDVYGGGYGANTKVKNTNVVTTSSAKVDSNVYGGSKDGIITGNTEMEINGKVLKSVYGAGEGVKSNVMGNTHLVLFGATVSGDVFGGGNKGGIVGDSHVDLLSGTVKGSVYGGSNQALVQGNSKVHMGIKAATNQKTPDVMKMIVENSVFGGGNTTDSGKAFDASNPFVLGDSEVLIDQEGYDYANFSIGKNILGDGNMCVTAGNKNISIKNYRDKDTIKTLSSIQRATRLTLESSWLELTGSMDSANLLPTMEYSLSRIDTLRLNGNASLNLYKEVNLVRALESYWAGVPVDEYEVMGAGGNTITLQQGIGFELRTNEDVSRPGYGTVVGYTRLGRYDKENKALTDGVYVLGGYDATNSKYGFYAGEDVFEKHGDNIPTIREGEKLTPETDSKSWNNWRLGRRVDVREITLVASDRPSYGKTIGVESTWAADGSIYRIDKDSLKIENQNGNNETFTFINPDTLSSQADINKTFGLEISTGQNGWLEQKNVGHIEGSTTGAGNSIVLQDDSDMIAVNDSKVQPLINVTLSNLTGITTKDDSSPLLVTFDINTYTKQADGTEMKTGTMTIKVNIIRDTAETYSDTTVEAGKNYKGAIQTYEYGTDHKSALTISKSSSITLQFARKASAGTVSPTRHELNFSTPLPNGTKILMIDRSTNDTKFYHYEAIANVSKIALSDFVANDSTDDKYSPIIAGDSPENYIFIIDFADVSSFSANNIDLSLTAYNGNVKIGDSKHIVFSVYGDQRIYTLSSLKDNENTYTSYSIGSTISVDLATSVNVTKLDGIDTTGRDKQMGARVRLYSVDNDSYINIPSTWEVISQGTHYAAGGNNFTINLADGLTVTNSNIYIQMSSIGNLPIGKYRLDIDLISGALANYPEDDSALAKNTIKIGIELKDYSYSIKSTMADKNRQLFSNTDTNKEVEINLEKATSAGVSTSGIYVQQTLYKKNEDNGKYESVNLDVLFDPSTLPLVNNKLAWDKNVLNYKYKDNIPAGTYRLQFDVMQADAFNDLAKSEDVVRATDTINIVVTDD